MNNARPWYNDAVFYHIFTLSLANAPQYNDYAKTEDRLAEIAAWIPHIKGLGCNAVLLSPVFQARSHGYDVTDYRLVDNRLGTNETLRKLVDAMHAAGIRVVLDSVFNHCGRDFFAFKALSKGDRSYAPWFSGVDFGRQSPLGDPFAYDGWSGHYELVKFNLQHASTRQYLLDAARFWIEDLHIDGMRLDAANVLDFDFMRALRQTVDAAKPDFWLMGELVGENYARWVAPGLLDSATNYILYKSLHSSHNTQNLYELAHCLQQSIAGHGLALYAFLDNHDQPRIASNVANPAYLSTLYALLFTLPGLPSIYYGSEWGIYGVKEGDSDQALRPYIDITKTPPDPGGLAAYIRGLAKIREGSDALRYGTYKVLYLAYQRPFVFERTYQDQRILVAVNITDAQETVDISEVAGQWTWTDLMTGETALSGDCVAIAPHTARILKACDA